MQRLNFGRIEGLVVRRGEPVFDPAPKVIQNVKIGGEDGSRPEAISENFLLKKQVIELLLALADLGEGTVLTIDVKHGLPFSLEVEMDSLRTTAAGVHRG